MADAPPSGDGAVLTGDELGWVANPWQRNWRRPAIALALCVVIALIGGWSVSYPNYLTHTPAPRADNAVADSGGSASAESAPHWGYQMIGWSALGLLFLLSMTATIYLPVRYRLDERGVTVRFLGAPSFRPWQHYRNFYVHDTVVHLTTMPRPSRLDPFRGHALQFASNRDEVVRFVERHLTRGGEATAREQAGNE